MNLGKDGHQIPMTSRFSFFTKDRNPNTIGWFLVDRVLLVLLAFGFGFVANWYVARQQTTRDYQKELFSSRLATYGQLIQKASRVRELMVRLYARESDFTEFADVLETAQIRAQYFDSSGRQDSLATVTWTADLILAVESLRDCSRDNSLYLSPDVEEAATGLIASVRDGMGSMGPGVVWSMIFFSGTIPSRPLTPMYSMTNDTLYVELGVQYGTMHCSRRVASYNNDSLAPLQLVDRAHRKLVTTVKKNLKTNDLLL